MTLLAAAKSSNKMAKHFPTRQTRTKVEFIAENQVLFRKKPNGQRILDFLICIKNLAPTLCSRILIK
jgi:hypothetical protein